VQCISDSDRNAILNLHNSGRSCAKVTALKWDSALETVAQNYANGCNFAHNAARSTQYKSISGKDTYVGENIAMGGPVSMYGMENLFGLWWDEQKDYTCGTPISGSNFGAFGHYTQIMWDDTTLLGCGVKVCNNQNYLVCNYAQGGNYMNELPYPVANCPSPTCKPTAAGGGVPTSDSPAPTSAPPAPTSSSEDTPTGSPTSQVVVKTSAPLPSTETTEPTIDVDLQVLVTVTLQVAPGIVSVNRFANEITGVLGIPQTAIQNIQVDLDQSSASTTVVHFILINAKVTDAQGTTTTVDPIAAAEKLKELAASKDPAIQTTTLLANMEVNSVVQQDEESPSFVQTSTFIIIIAVVGGVVLISAAVAVTIVIVKRKGRTNWF